MFQRSLSFDPNTCLFSTMIEKDHNRYIFVMNIIIPRINCANEDILDLCDLVSLPSTNHSRYVTYFVNV